MASYLINVWNHPYGTVTDILGACSLESEMSGYYRYLLGRSSCCLRSGSIKPHSFPQGAALLQNVASKRVDIAPYAKSVLCKAPARR